MSVLIVCNKIVEKFNPVRRGGFAVPLYEFRCQDCQHRFTVLIPYEEKDRVVCSHCGSTRVRLLIGSFSVAGGPPARCTPSSPQGG